MVFMLLVCCFAQVFAAECGDVNSSGEIDILDALLIAQYYVDLNPSNFDPGAANVSGDGSIDILDAVRKRRIYIHLLLTLIKTGINTVPLKNNNWASTLLRSTL